MSKNRKTKLSKSPLKKDTNQKVSPEKSGNLVEKASGNSQHKYLFYLIMFLIPIVIGENETGTIQNYHIAI